MFKTREGTALIAVSAVGMVVLLVLGYVVYVQMMTQARAAAVSPTPVPTATHTASLTPPTPTPTPRPIVMTAVTTVQPTSCVDGMRLVEHLSYDPQDAFAPHTFRANRQFTKRWRIQNTGTCVWDPGYSLAYVDGSHPAADMEGAAVVLHGRTYPSETYDIEAKLISPPEAGLYQGYWQMRSASGTYFGERLPVMISVAAPLPPTREPTWTPQPRTTIQFQVDRDRIVGGECALFSWAVSNAQAAYLHQEGQAWQANGVPFIGQRQVCPLQTTTYYLRVIRPSGWVDLRSLVVHVVQPAAAPQIQRFTVEPASVTLGECVTLGWEVRGQVSGVRILRDGGIWWDHLPWFGSLSDCPASAGQAAYRLEASGPGGTASMERTVFVSAVPTPSPAPLSGTAWQVLAIGNSVPIGQPPTVTFGPQDANGQGTLFGWSSCNTYSAPYQQTGSLLAIGAATVGDNLCTPALAAQEQALLDALDATASFSSGDGQLVLKNLFGGVELNLAAITPAAP